MGWFSSVCSFVGSAISSVCSGIGKACSAIGGFVANTICPLAASISPIFSVVSGAVSVIANLLGIGKQDREMEHYGEAMTMAERKPEEFDSIQEYIDYLDAEIRSGNIQLNENKTELDKDIHKTMGCSLMIKGIEEKYSLKTDAEFWGTIGTKMSEGKLSGEEVKNMFEHSQKNNIDIRDVANYMDNRELQSDAKKSDISEIIDTSIKEANPQKSDAELIKQFNTLLKKDKE